MPPKPAAARAQHCVFVTGQPGSGKTTLVARVCERLRALGVTPTGFYTEEVRRGGERTGFDVVTLDGQRGPLARVGKAAAGQPTVGSYVVNLTSFEALALPSLALTDPAGSKAATSTGSGSRKRARDATTTEDAGDAGAGGGSSRPRVVVIDEVGKMELFSPAFQARVSALLDRPDVVVLGSVPMPRYGREIDFVGRIKARPDVALVKVLKGTREEAYEEALGHVLAALGLPPP